MSTGSKTPYPPKVQALAEEAIAAHEEYEQAKARMNDLLTLRRARILKARAHGVSGYYLSKRIGLSQTMIGNICSEK